MKAGFLQNFKVGDTPLPKEVIDAILAENDHDIEAAKKPYADYESVKDQLRTATEGLKVFEGVDVKDLQGQIAKLTKDLSDKEAEHTAKLAELEFDGALKDAITALNYAQAYSQALAQAYPYVLHFAALRSAENDFRYRWVNANTVQIPSLTTTGRVDADRDTIGVAKRNFDNAWEPKTLANHRKWSTLVHPLDIDETNQVTSIQNITKVFNEEQKFPEMDAYLISKLYAEWGTAGGTADTTALTEDNILTVFDGYMVAMDEANVPKVGRILYTTPVIKSMLKNAKELNRFIQNGDAAIRRAVSSLEEVQIEDVPSTLMKTVYDFTEGWKAGAGAQQINMALVHPSAVITPEKYTFAQLDSPSAGICAGWKIILSK